jgi:pimeloyl-ACP methyl ester carboxylesterase
MMLLPGMAANEMLFEPQRRAFPGLIVPPWSDPDPREPLACYARRMAGAIKLSRPAIIGGVSFGGIVALEMANHLGLAECVLISSIRTFPVAYTHPDRIVPGGGHLLTLTHPVEVNNFLSRARAGLA